ncbi:hypothetical protein OX90_16265 [Pseudomonas coronafaciens pv. porri]|uniref:Uncharacterized protein n=1 Tax=Pseudomonas coronafaciens pv. porri TaxID=83964 RepID=A0ABR5JM08_9PSED|nr:hypothetical protein OX90_16265 [Pseudomonas coronafaciens pv. porri]
MQVEAISIAGRYSYQVRANTVSVKQPVPGMIQTNIHGGFKGTPPEGTALADILNKLQDGAT